MERVIEEIRAFAFKGFSDAKGSHNWEHTCRVLHLCSRIGEVENADRQILEIAAYLHDIGRPWQDRSKGVICHAKKGAETAEKELGKHQLSSEKKDNIIHCIRSHRFRGKNKPETLEAKILFDADKLDAIGAVGIARAFQFAGEVGAKLHIPDIDPKTTKSYSEEDTGYREYKVKLSRIKGRMLTAEGRRIAAGRHEFMEKFFERFLHEHEGIL